MSTSRRQADLNVRLPDIIDPDATLEGFAAGDPDGNAVAKFLPDEFSAPGIKTRLGGPDGTVTEVDADGYALLHYGVTAFRHLVTDALRADLDRAGFRGGSAERFRALCDLIMILIYGQSLARGSGGTPAMSTSPLAYAWMFIGGARPYDANNDLDDPDNYASLTALLEQDNDVAGETIASACAMMIKQLLLDEQGIDLEEAGQQQLLFSNMARSGQTVESLSGSPHIDRFNLQMDYGQERADGLSKSFGVAAMTWIQGEADYNADTLPSVWKESVRLLRRTAQAHALQATGAARLLPMFLCQTASHLHYGRTTPGIALAQLELAAELPFVFVTPKYFMPYSDEQHGTNVFYKWLGAYYGLAIYRALFCGIKVQPLVPVQVERAGKCVFLRYDSELVIDTTTVAADAAGFYGFRLADPLGDPLSIDSVDLIRDARVIRITADATIPDFARVQYAWEGPDDTIGIGNVRDTQGDAIVFDPSDFNKPLHRWHPIYERVL